MPTVSELLNKGKEIKLVQPAPSSSVPKLSDVKDRAKLVTPETAPKSEPTGVFAGIKEDFKRRDANVKASVAAARRGEQTHIEGVFQSAGQVAGLVGDVGLRVLGKGASAVTPDVIEKPVRKASRAAVESVIGSKAVQKGVEKYQEFKQEHPRAARNIEAGINMLSILPEFKATELAGTASKGVLKTTAKTTLKAGQPVVRAAEKMADAFGDLPRRMEQINLRLTPVQKQNLGRKLNDVTNFIAEQEIVGDQAKKFARVSEITEGMEDTIQNYLKKDLGDPEISVLELRDRIKSLKSSPEFRNERDLPLIERQIDGMDQRLALYGTSIKLSDLNELKRSTYREAYNKAGDKVADWVEHDMADIFKTTIEDVGAKSGKQIDGMEIGAFNKRYGTAIEARKLLKISQSRPQIGLVGKIVGTMVGGTIGTAVGGPAGAAAGLILGPKIGETVAGSTARTMLGIGAKRLKQIEPSVGLSIKDVSGMSKSVTPESVGKYMDMKDIRILEAYLNNPADLNAFIKANPILEVMRIAKADRATQTRFLREAIGYAKDRLTKKIPVRVLK